MGQRTADEDKQNNATVNDELSADIVSEFKRNAELEIKQFKQNLIDIDKAIANYSEQWDVDKKLFEIQLEGDNHHLVTPTYKYQELPLYWELVKKKIAFSFKEQNHLAKQRFKGWEIQKEQIQEQIDSSQAKLDELEEERKE